MSERGFQGGSGAGSGVTGASTQTFFPLIGRIGWGSNGGSTTEAFCQVKWRGAATFANWYVNVPTNGRATATALALRQNGADTAVVISITAGATGVFADTTHSVAIADGDLVCGAITTGTGAGTITLIGTGHEVGTTGQTFSMVGNSSSAAGSTLSTNNSTTTYGVGVTNSSGTESRTQMRAAEAAVLSNFQIYVSANARTTTTSAGTRKGGSNLTQVVSITAGATGLFEDTTHSDTLVIADLYNFRITWGASAEALTWRMMGCKYTSPTANVSVLTCSAQAFAQSAGSTFYYPAAGAGQTASATESVERTPAPYPGTLANAGVVVSANASSTTTTFAVRQNGATTGLTVAVGAGATGQFADTTHTVDIAAGDLLNWIGSGATTGDLTMGSFVALLTADAVVSIAAFAPSPDFGAPTLIQAHAISVAAVASSPAFGSIAISQVHALSLANFAASPAFGTVTLFQAHQLSVATFAAAAAFGSVDFTQAHGLTVGDVSAAPDFGGPAITQVHGLSVADFSAAPAFGSVSLAQHHNFTVADVSAAAAFGDVTVTQGHAVSVANFTTSPAFGSAAISQAHVVSVASFAWVPVFGSPLVRQLRPPTVHLTGEGRGISLTGEGRAVNLVGHVQRDG